MIESNKSLHTIALVGRPNVGKSTLFNWLTRSKDAIVADYPGLTRDRIYGLAHIDKQEVVVIDTGGLEGHEEEAELSSLTQPQTQLALEESDLILFVLDAQVGRLPGDELIAKRLRQLTNKHVLCVVNKIDGCEPHTLENEFRPLGFTAINLVSAIHRRGLHELQESILEHLAHVQKPLTQDQTQPDENPEPAQAIRVAILGKPNAGKSTLMNRLLGEERVVVSEYAGTTRDSVAIPLQKNGTQYCFIDTAGIRRKSKVHQTVEKFSIVKALESLAKSHVVIIVIDAEEGISDQDLHLIRLSEEQGRCLILAVNKWDKLSGEARKNLKQELKRRLAFNHYAEVITLSALKGTQVNRLFPAIKQAYRNATQQLTTHQLNELLGFATMQHQPPMKQGRRIKLRYAHPGGQCPPTIIIHGNQTEKLPKSYVRYLEGYFRERLDFRGTPLRLILRTSDNPYV